MSETTEGRSVRILLVILGVLAGGCAARREAGARARAPDRTRTAVRVETRGAQVVHASAAGAPDGSARRTVGANASATQPSGDDPVSPDLASPPPEKPARLPPPKIIPEGEKATLIYPCRHAETDTLRQAVEVLLSPEGAIHASPALNALVVSDKATLIQSLLEVLQELDAPTSQLLVEARVVEVSASRDLEYEIKHAFTTPAGAGTFVQGGGVDLAVPGASNPGQGADLALKVWENNDRRFDTFLRLLNSRGRARILSSPNLVVAPGEEASIITGEEVPVQSSTIAGGSITNATQFKRVGIKLRVQLLQLTNDTARVEINPEVSTVTGFTAASQGQAANPIIAIRNVTSTLSLKDGEMLTVGGLLRNEKRRTTRGVPLLEDIPVAGLLFQSRLDSMVRTQLIFFLRVRIISSGEAEAIRAHRPGAGLEVLDPVTDFERLPKGDGKMPPNLRPTND